MQRPIHLFLPATIALVAFGAFAFGAEFTWAYAALLPFSVTVSALGFSAARPLNESPFDGQRNLLLALLLLLGAAIVQTVPLPTSVLSAISPSRNVVDYKKAYAQADLQEVSLSEPAESSQTISIAPSRSVLAIAFFSVFVVLLFASAQAFRALGPTNFVRCVIVVGVIAACAEIAQKASGSSIMYGLFAPRQLKYQSAPFINRNHTAGWLIMVLALTVGHIAGCVEAGLRGLKPRWRARMLWWASGEATEAVFAAFAAIVLAIAVVATESRSGSLCLVLTALAFAWQMLRRQGSLRGRLLLSMLLLIVAISVMVIGHGEGVTRRFEEARIDSLDGRFDIWRDALSIVRDFPLTGTGLNTFGIAMLHYQTLRNGFFYIEAHNDYLQLAAEGGALLAIPLLIAIVVLSATVWRRFSDGMDGSRIYWLRVGAAIALLALGFQSIFDFTLQMPGAAVLFVTVIAIAIHRPLKKIRSTS